MTDAEITADDPDLPGVILTMRLANMGAAVALIVAAVRFVSIFYPDTIATFSCLSCCVCFNLYYACNSFIHLFFVSRFWN